MPKSIVPMFRLKIFLIFDRIPGLLGFLLLLLTGKQMPPLYQHIVVLYHFLTHMTRIKRDFSNSRTYFPNICLLLYRKYDILPSLTVERVKRGYKPSKYGRCSFFRPCIDMCYILSLSKTFVFLMRVRMEVLVMIS